MKLSVGDYVEIQVGIHAGVVGTVVGREDGLIEVELHGCVRIKVTRATLMPVDWARFRRAA